MTYSADSPIVGEGTATSAEIDELFHQVAAERNQGFTTAPPGLGAAFIRWCHNWNPTINHDLAAAQSAHETAGWTSWWAADPRNNSAGIGVDGVAGHGELFATVDESIECQVAHLLTYAAGEGPWTAKDRRYAHTPPTWIGVTKLLRDLNGRWAFPGTTYGQSVAKLANQLLTIDVPDAGGSVVSKPQMRTDVRSKKFDGYDAEDGMPRQVEAICRHISDGQKPGDLVQLTQVVSANYYIDKSGVIYELVPPDHSAWTNGQVNKPDLSNPLIADWVAHGWNPNTRTLSIEHEGHKDDHFTKEQWASTTHLGAWLSQEYHLPSDRTHNIGHYQIDSVNRPYCPGLTANEWQYLIDRQTEILNGPQPDKWVPGGSPNGFGFVLGFKGWAETQAKARYAQDINAGILSITGYPQEEEWGGTDGRSYQRCERCTLQYNPNTAAPFDIVLLPLSAKLPEKAQ